MSTSQGKGKRWWVAIALNCLLWGSGHYYLGYKKLGIILIVVEAYFILTFRPTWISIIPFPICTAFICYDSYKRTSTLRKPLGAKERLVQLKDFIRILDYKIIIVAGLIVFLIGYVLINRILTITGTVIIVVGYTMRLKSSKK